MLSLWMTLLCSVDSGEALFEKAMSLESTQSQVAFIEAAESCVHDAATNADPNVAFNAGLAWARAGNRPQAKQMLLYAVARGATPEAWRALQLVREEDGLDAIQGPMPWFAPLARLGVVISTLLPAPAVVAGGMLTLSGLLWGLRRSDLALLSLAAAFKFLFVLEYSLKPIQ